MEWLTSALFEISSALLLPCVALLVLFFGCTLIHLGEFLREILERRRFGPRWSLPPLESCDPSSEASSFEVAIDRLEMRLEVVVERTSLLAKVGPMLGLAGTLIPLGPALKGMASGNVAALSHNLIVAFTTTVVGLAIAGPCYWISTVRKRWYSHDLAQLESSARASSSEAAGKENARDRQTSS